MLQYLKRGGRDTMREGGAANDQNCAIVHVDMHVDTYTALLLRYARTRAHDCVTAQPYECTLHSATACVAGVQNRVDCTFTAVL